MVRYILFIVLATLLVSCGHYYVLPQREIIILEEKKPVEVKPKGVVVVDAGHGGKDLGTVNKNEHCEEKNLTLKTVVFLKNCLKQLGYEVILTRSADENISLKNRTEFANSKKSDIFVSVHYNFSFNHDPNGIEIFYYREKSAKPSTRISESKRLAGHVLSKLILTTSANSRGVKQANFSVVRDTKMPAILVEAGFLSNAKECRLIKDQKYQKAIAWGIAKGIDEFFNPPSTAKKEISKR